MIDIERPLLAPAQLDEIEQRWEHTGGKRWRWDDQGERPDGSHDEDLCGVVCVWLEPHGYADVLTFGDMEVNDGTDIRNSEAVAAAPEDVTRLLGDVRELRQAAREALMCPICAGRGTHYDGTFDDDVEPVNCERRAYLLALLGEE